MSVSISEIKEIASNLFHESPEERANQCSRLTEILYMELCSHSGLQVQPKKIVGGFEYEDKRTPHKFLLLSEEAIEDAATGPVIIDPTVQQFCKVNKQASKVDVDISIENEYSLPDSVGVYTPIEEEYELYSF